MEQMNDKSFPRMRRSACADASLRAEIERLKKMSAEERILSALDMGKIFGWGRSDSKSEDVDGGK